MKFSLGWLKEYLELTKEEELRIPDILLQSGVEVNSAFSHPTDGFELVEIIAVAKHPNADTLNICTLKDKSNTIVCGASNVKVGLRCILANIGAIVQGKELKAREIRGVLSEGMLCSGGELGLSDDGEGLFVPEVDSIETIFNPNGVIYDVSITPNRGDLLCVYGIARELAAFGVGNLKNITSQNYSDFTKPSGSEFVITVDSEDALSMYSGKISNLKTNITPLWIRRRLSEVGIKSHNLVVDVTNYIAHGLGQPLHAFDADVVNQIQVKKTQSCTFTDLKGQSHQLSDTTIMISGDHVVSLPGIIGGNYGKCLDSTSAILLEAGNYTREHIYAGRKIHKTRASDLFFHGVDPAITPIALLEAASMITSLGGGQLSKTYVTKEYTSKETIIRCVGNPKLAQLGFVRRDDGWAVPSWRHDILNDQDLEQELLRLDGYDTLAKLPFVPIPQKPQVTLHLQEDFLRHSLVKDGLYEVVNMDFMSKAAHEITPNGVVLENPISDSYYALRSTLLHGLIDVYGSYLRYGWDCPGIFEIGDVFNPQRRELGIALSRNKGWLKVDEKFSYFQQKQIFEKIVSGLYGDLDTRCVAHPILQDCCAWVLGEAVIGIFGVLGNQHQKRCKVKETMYLGTVLLGHDLPDTRPYLDTSHAVVTRDISLLVPANLEISRLLSHLKQQNLDLYPFDLHPDANLGTQARSIGIRILFNQLARVMLGDELNAIVDKICAMARDLGCEVR